VLAGIAIGLLALNLRPFVGSLGVVLPQVRANLALSASVAGVLTALPVLAFALAGPFAPRLAARVGMRGAAVGSLGVLALALIARGFAHSSWWFVAMTALAPAAVAVGNVILPALVKQHFPERTALGSSLATALVVLGGAIGSAATVSVAGALGGWRVGLGVWGAAAALAALFWLLPGLRRSGSNNDSVTPDARGWPTAFRSPLAWALMAVFAAQSMGAYVGFGWLPAIYTSAGVSLGEAGLLVGVWSLLGVPMGLLVPVLLRSGRSSPWVPWLWAVSTAAGWLGLIFSHGHAVWIWTILLGVGSGAFPWVLSMVAMHSHSVADAALLSGFVQSIGYLLAAVGPFGFGALHDLTGSWRLSLSGMAVVSLVIGVAGTIVARHPPSDR
jgi:CP family cyanate transporter-like MFS transporter